MSQTQRPSTLHAPRDPSASHTKQTGATSAPDERRSWAVLALALVAQVLVVLDISVVNTALPTIGDALTLSNSDM